MRTLRVKPRQLQMTALCQLCQIWTVAYAQVMYAAPISAETPKLETIPRLYTLKIVSVLAGIFPIEQLLKEQPYIYSSRQVLCHHEQKNSYIHTYVYNTVCSIVNFIWKKTYTYTTELIVWHVADRYTDLHTVVWKKKVLCWKYTESRLYPKNFLTTRYYILLREQSLLLWQQTTLFLPLSLPLCPLYHSLCPFALHLLQSTLLFSVHKVEFSFDK